MELYNQAGRLTVTCNLYLLTTPKWFSAAVKMLDGVRGAWFVCLSVALPYGLSFLIWIWTDQRQYPSDWPVVGNSFSMLDGGNAALGQLLGLLIGWMCVVRRRQPIDRLPIVTGILALLYAGIGLFVLSEVESLIRDSISGWFRQGSLFGTGCLSGWFVSFLAPQCMVYFRQSLRRAG